MKEPDQLKKTWRRWKDNNKIYLARNELGGS
jgi:hypothetical protein